MKHTSKQLYGLATVFLVGGLSFNGPVLADSTMVSQSVTPGLLTIRSDGYLKMSDITTDVTQYQHSNGIFSTTATDSRGTYTGWSVTASMTGFSMVNEPKQTSGAGGGLHASGSNNGENASSYDVKIVQSGAIGEATYVVSGDDITDTTTPIPISNTDTPIGTRGVLVKFDPQNYSVGDEWHISTELIPPSNIQITPSNVTAFAGSVDGVETGETHVFSSTTDNTALMSSREGKGGGQYSNLNALQVSIPPITRSGNYLATITETIN